MTHHREHPVTTASLPSCARLEATRTMRRVVLELRHLGQGGNERPGPALSKPAWAHARETLIWTRMRGARYTVNHDLVNGPGPPPRAAMG